MSTPRFADHFSGHSSDYAQFRPTYPAALFEWIGAQAPGRTLAWDVGTGSGQAAVKLAEHFGHVIGTDASAQQVQSAQQAAKVEYRVCPAESSGLPDRSVDAVCVAQALHWFDFPRFFAEVRRVAVPDGLLAAWSYEMLAITPEVDAVVHRLYHDIVGGDWPAQRLHVERGYRDIPFPWTWMETPRFSMDCRWTREQLTGYLSTWSACKRFQARTGVDPLSLIGPELAKAWPDAQESRRVEFPLTLVGCRVR